MWQRAADATVLPVLGGGVDLGGACSRQAVVVQLLRHSAQFRFRVWGWQGPCVLRWCGSGTTTTTVAAAHSLTHASCLTLLLILLFMAYHSAISTSIRHCFS